MPPKSVKTVKSDFTLRTSSTRGSKPELSPEGDFGRRASKQGQGSRGAGDQISSGHAQDVQGTFISCYHRMQNRFTTALVWPILTGSYDITCAFGRFGKS
jgi:hypothetical protein